ncbi:PAS domain S-box protein [Marinobacterium sp. AK62]|uniref:PAS domain S-box protein n=1 Tax=Marinobacterium alkalitolerans TaxID=1542925 RepID=A0ABS3ZBH8_9GAMM|nr:PAS domain S-box protein [Marinobacterium alkalitolerans]MBP0049060.1 PAS domain S-box protein [Marinobacterium alkalitolerans]
MHPPRSRTDTQRVRKLSPVLALVTCLVGITISTVLAVKDADNLRSTLESRFNNNVQQTTHFLQQKVERYELLLKAGRGLVLNNWQQPPETLESHWHAMFDSFDLDLASLGVVGLSFTAYLPADARPAFVEGYANTHHDFEIYPPPPPSEDSFVILQLTPRSIERRMRGYDIASGPARREAALQAKASGQATVTTPLSLLPTEISSLDYLMLLPVQTKDGTDQSFLGWTSIGFSMSTLLNSSLEELGHPLRIQLFDTRQDEARPAFDSHREMAEGKGPSQSSTIHLGMQQVRLEFQSLDSELNQLYNRPFNPGTLVAGLSLTLLVTLAMLSFIITRLRTDLFNRQLSARANEVSERYRNLFEQSPEAIVVHVEGRVELANPHAAELFGCDTPEALIGCHIRDLVHPDSMGIVETRQAALKRGESLMPAEQKLIRLDGTLFEVEATSRLIQFNHRTGTQVVFRDITAEKQARREARIAHALVKQNSEAIMVTDAEGNIEMVNEAFETLTGYGRNQIIGSNASLMNSGQHGRAFFFELWRALKQKGEWSGDIVNRKRSGKLFVQATQITAVQDESEHTSHFVCRLRDVTDARQQQGRLQLRAFQAAMATPEETR